MKFLILLLLLSLAAGPGRCAATPLTAGLAAETVAEREARENKLWTAELQAVAQKSPPAVRAALEQILRDVEALASLDAHKAHDALLATRKKLERNAPYLDSPVGNFGEVEAGRLYRGAQPSPKALRWLAEQGIGTIVLLREPGVEETNYPGYSRADYIRDIRSLGMEVVEIVVRDRTIPTPSQIREFLDAVRASKRPSFVHCSAGIGRTGIMAGFYQRARGLTPEQALEHDRQFLLDPARVPDHLLQASLIANLPLSKLGLEGSQGLVDLPWPARLDVNPVAAALELGQPVRLPDEATIRMDPENPAPALEKLAAAVRNGSFVRLEFGTGDDLEVLASLARGIPASQKMGVVQRLEDLDRARNLLGPVPFEVRVHIDERTDFAALARALKGKAQIVNAGPLTPALMARLKAVGLSVAEPR